jgi:hypothetical protein
MVLDAKALTWAAQHDIDTAKLKRAKVPIYGKWYFPEIPADVPLTNLETGAQQIFPERMIAGEVIFVPSAELVRAGLAPADFAVIEVPPLPGEAAAAATTRALSALPPEPLLAMARPPGLEEEVGILPFDPDQVVATEAEPDLSGIHMPSASIAPFVLGLGFCLVFLGLITNVVIVVTGLLWMLAGAIVWIRIGLLEYRATHAPSEAEHSP